MKRTFIICFLWAFLFISGAFASTGELRQLDGRDGCINENGAGGCKSGRALKGLTATEVSPDGKNVYISARDSESIAIFSRDPLSGKLVQLDGVTGCVSHKREVVEGEACGNARGMGFAESLVTSAEGRQLYVISVDILGHGIAIFQRDTATGTLSQRPGGAGCVSEFGYEGCDDGRALEVSNQVAIDPSGKNIYVSSFGSSAFPKLPGFLSIFSRREEDGALSQLGGRDGCFAAPGSFWGKACTDGKALLGVASVAVSHDGKNVYIASHNSNAVANFSRDHASGKLTQLECLSRRGSESCKVGRALYGTASVAVSPDDRNVYVASMYSNSVAVFRRNPSTGKLSQLRGDAGCISEHSRSGMQCAEGRGLSYARAVTVSGDGKNVYVSSIRGRGVAIFNRDPSTGELGQLPGRTGCVTDKGDEGCTAGRGLGEAYAIELSPDDRNVYLTSRQNQAGAVAVFIRKTSG